MDLFKKGKQTEELLKLAFKQNGIQFIDFGREHLIKESELSKTLSQSHSETAKSIRFTPDLIAYKKDWFYAESKTGQTIAEEPFKYYLKIEEQGKLIFIFFLFEQCFYFCKPSEVPFCVYEGETVFHYKTKLNIPLKESIWYCPRLLPENDYKAFKSKMKGSGTSFGQLDKEKLKQLKKLPYEIKI